MEREPGNPVASLVLGLIGMLAWIIPIVGLSITITGLIAGLNGMKRTNPKMAIVGVVLCSLGLLASVANALWGAYLIKSGSLHTIRPL